MRPSLLALLALLALALGAPTTLVTEDNASELVGMTRLEAKLAATSRFGMYELSLTPDDLKDIVNILRPLDMYEESKTNVLLMDEFPFVPTLSLPQHNASVVLSNLRLEGKMNPELVQVEFLSEHQSIRIVDLSLTATFDWRINKSKIGGQAKVIVPQAWIHQNVEIACSSEQPSMLVWEGRYNLLTSDIYITTSIDDKSFVDELAQVLHSSKTLRTYIGNALQHQLASSIGKWHWKMQERMREDCLLCHGMRYSSSRVEMLIKGDARCITNMPSYMIEPLVDETTNPEDLARITPSTIKKILRENMVKTSKVDDILESQGLSSVTQEVTVQPDSLRPRQDWREKFRHHTHPGFIEDPEGSHPWMKKIGKLWNAIRGKSENTSNSTAPATR